MDTIDEVISANCYFCVGRAFAELFTFREKDKNRVAIQNEELLPDNDSKILDHNDLPSEY